MELKHTIEILTKDIQDIEKLVGSLQNSDDRNTLELDLALSKIRNVYEILTLIREDRLRDLVPPRPESESRPEPEKVAGPAPAAAAPEPASEPAAAAAEPVDEPAAEKEPTGEPKAEPKAETAAAGPGQKAEIIAEKFSTGSSINENLAGKRGEGMESKLSGKPIDNIGRNIGINDRFLIIRELFDGDVEKYAHLIDSLEGASNYKEAVGLLEACFPDGMDHEGIGILAGLVKRRYSEQ
jgi:hypothetical protein